MESERETMLTLKLNRTMRFTNNELGYNRLSGLRCMTESSYTQAGRQISTNSHFLNKTPKKRVFGEQ